MNIEEESFAKPLGITLNAQSIKPIPKSYKLECITPDKQPRVEETMSMKPKFESEVSRVWKNKYSDSYFVSNKITGDLYLVSEQDINECMEALQCYYTKISVEIFEVLIKYDFNIDNTIAELTWRYN